MFESDLTYSYTSAIDKLPRTLAVMGESLMQQTGWQISILAGGPLPENGGKVVTYL